MPAARLVHLLVLLLALLLGASATQAAQDPGSRVLDAGWSVAIDRSRALTIAELERLRFEPFAGAPALGYVDGVVWLRHTLTADPAGAGERFIELQLPGIDEATLLWPQRDGTFSSRTAGDHHPMSARDVRHRNVVFRVDLPREEDVTFYLRVAGTHNQTFSVVLWEPTAFLEAALREQLLWGALLALHVVLILSNLWLFQATRDAPTGLFALYTTASFGTIMLVEGFGHAYLLDGLPALNHALLVAFWMMSVPATYLFVFGFVELLDGRRRWPGRVVAAVAGIAAVSVLIDLTLDARWIRPSFSALQALSAPVLAGVLVWRSLQRVAAAQLLLVAMLPTLAAVALKLLRNLGVLEPNLWLDSGYFLALAFYLLVLNFAISRRVEALRRSKDHAQAQALALSRRTERELELRVAQRTEQVASAMQRTRDTLELERRFLDEQRILFQTISHELRTPVAVICAATENLMLQGQGVAEPNLTRYRKIYDASKRLANLLNDNLREGRFMSVEAIARLEHAPTHELLEDAVAMARLRSDSHPMQVSVAPGAERIWCDSVLTRLALNVLAENAVRYTLPGTAVKLTARIDQAAGRTQAVLEIADAGPGVAAVELARLFEPGFRAGTARRTEGSGLGLSLARRLVELQGGTLTLHSQPGQGFTGTIRLPVAG